MKKLFLVLACVALATVLFVGCLPEWIIPGEGEEEEPELVMEAVATAELVGVEAIEAVEGVEAVEAVEEEVDENNVVIVPGVEGVEGVEAVEGVEGYWNVDWAIVNTGDLFIREYILTFVVDYPNIAKDLVTFDVTGKFLEIGKFKKGTIRLATYGDNEAPEDVSVTCELFE